MRTVYNAEVASAEARKFAEHVAQSMAAELVLAGLRIDHGYRGKKFFTHNWGNGALRSVVDLAVHGRGVGGSMLPAKLVCKIGKHTLARSTVAAVDLSNADFIYDHVMTGLGRCNTDRARNWRMELA